MSGFSAAQAIISAMFTPALRILAPGSLMAMALVRLARMVDRVRKLAGRGARASPAAELHRHARRVLLAESALQCHFSAVACFVLAGIAIGIDDAAADRLTRSGWISKERRSFAAASGWMA